MNKCKLNAVYYIKNGNIQSKTEFFPSNELPINIPVSTPLTFPQKKENFVLTLDKNNWWNPICGHIEEGETWKEALHRESLEEAGIDIDQIAITGFILITKLLEHPDNKYPAKTVIPVTSSRVTRILDSWDLLETKGRIFSTYEESIRLLKERTDNQQMRKVFEYMFKNHE